MKRLSLEPLMCVGSPCFRSARLRSTGILLLLSCICSACAVPSSSLTSVRVTGQVLDTRGEPLSDKTLEVVLPAEYGLNEIDLEQGDPQSYGHSDQYAKVRTDSLGSFVVEFAPVEYSSAFWILPPLGTLLSEPPTPKLFLRLPETEQKYYSIFLKEDGALYGVYQTTEGLRGLRGTHSVPTPAPATLETELLSDYRDGMKTWIANLGFQLVPQSGQRMMSSPSKRTPAQILQQYPERARIRTRN